MTTYVIAQSVQFSRKFINHSKLPPFFSEEKIENFVKFLVKVIAKSWAQKISLKLKDTLIPTISLGWDALFSDDFSLH